MTKRAWPLVLAALLFAARAEAEASRVVIVRERGADAVVTRAEVRLAAELRAAGFVVEERTVDTAADARRVVDDESGGAFATILLQRAGGGAATDIWVADHVTKKTVVRRIAGAPGEGGDRVLAMRVVELMRASLVEPIALPPPAEAPRVEPPPDVARFVQVDRVAPQPAPERTSFAIAAGASALYASSSIGVAWAPSIAIDFEACSICRVRALVVGPAFGATVDAAQGSARVRQELALVEFGLEAPLARVRPFVAIGGGAYHLDARGTARAPYTDGAADAWAALASAGFGARLRIAGAAHLSLGARALFAFPRPVVTFAGESAASAGRPALLATLALEVDL